MKNRIDYILLGLLWILVATLTASFWFNTAFGFNIFSAQHWQYLAYMQAAHQSVKPMFYVSLVASIIIMVAVLYMMVRPRLRRIKLQPAKRPTNTTYTSSAPSATMATQPQNKDASSITVVTAPAQPTPSVAPVPAPAQNNAAPTGAPSVMRPPRLTLPAAGQMPTTPPAPQSKDSAVVRTATPDQNKYTDELKQIFESAGYTTKHNPTIRGVQTALLAIGVNEALWMGGVGLKTADMQMAIDRMQQVFADTLEDIEIHATGFVINAPDAANPEYKDILLFDSVDALREYMSTHPSPPVPPDDQGNFEAYSEYITTVADYIGKI